MSARPSASAAADRCADRERCITCGDVALELCVLTVDDRRGLALCEDRGGRRETVQTALVAPVVAGDRLLVHAGTAIARLAAEPGQGGAGQRSAAQAGAGQGAAAQTGTAQRGGSRR